MTPFLWLDFDGVLHHWPSHLFELTQAELSQVQSAAFDPDLLQAAITGKCSDEEWRQAAALRLSEAVGMTEAARMVGQLSAPCGEIDHRLLDLVYELGFRGRIGLITNATSRLGADLRRLGIDQEFAHIINSSELGAAKPSPEVFLHALSLSGSPGLFVDDSHKNCEAASQAGLPAHCFTHRDGFEAWLRSVL